MYVCLFKYICLEQYIVHIIIIILCILPMRIFDWSKFLIVVVIYLISQLKIGLRAWHGDDMNYRVVMAAYSR